ncbi:MAG TPA: family 1 encapsulin nanocompartment shell protein [Myxococcota bacterium]|nr:family 1 encapsulin nanocompartment shell protein [Myxococcota bacterium]
MALHRDLAPLSAAAWCEIDEAAREVLQVHLAGRRVMDFVGPLGWDESALDLGRTAPVAPAPSGLDVRRRVVRPLVELRSPFRVSREEMERADRGARDLDLDAVRDAAELLARFEDEALLLGCAGADVPGLLESSLHEPVPIDPDPLAFAATIAHAVETLRQAAVAGPYALALGSRPYEALDAAGEGGFPVRRHVERLLGGPIVWARVLEGGAVVSQRGGDFRFVCGRDASIGYLGHDATHVYLYLEESFTSEIPGPEAVVALRGNAP